jgi:sialidase-1
LLCSYGHRRLPFGVRGCISEDSGETWNITAEKVLCDDLPNANLGYPSSIVASPGRVFTAYYAEDDDAVTGIHGTLWEA